MYLLVNANISINFLILCFILYVYLLLNYTFALKNQQRTKLKHLIHTYNEIYIPNEQTFKHTPFQTANQPSSQPTYLLTIHPSIHFYVSKFIHSIHLTTICIFVFGVSRCFCMSSISPSI